ncbi:hypothetical protein GCM10009811_17680 [Nostocoides veronense]|uniref:Uncharacterized protein n=1 Tax=Nostocoides veronense TaxID=330836 RepID=A0ABN2LMA8_9MICO
MAGTISASKAAALLHISPSHLSHRSTSTPLFSVKIGRARRYFRRQFADGQVLPGLATLAARLTGAYIRWTQRQ